MHALIIEPNALFATEVSEELVDLGYGSFDYVWNERDAVSSALTRCPDLIVGDHLLHEGNGVAAIREICRNKRIPTVFIVADHTALGQIIPGAVVIEKPFKSTEFREAVETARLIVDERNLMLWQVRSNRWSSC